MTDLNESLALAENQVSTSQISGNELSFRQLLNITACCFGIQFGWSLQNANMSAIFEYLGANPHQLPLLWLAAPLTGLIVQPIIGYLSDRTWGILGRRRPYFLVGGVMSAIAMVAIPSTSSLWLAVLLLWILDTSVNISMEPFRAFIGDLVPYSQYARGYALQSTLVGAGAVTASVLPWAMSHILPWDLGLGIPISVKLSFYVGAFMFLSTILWTVFTTTERQPSYISHQPVSFKDGWQNLAGAIRKAPLIMQQLAWVQGFTWVGMFCVFLFLAPSVAWHIFHAQNENSALYRQGVEWAGLGLAVDNATCFIFAGILPTLISRFGARLSHSLCLSCGGISLISLWFVGDRWLFFLPMVGLGIAWSSILTIPYTLLMDKLPPEQRGIYTGIFNFFIVLPQIATSLIISWAMEHLFAENHLAALVIGGISMIIAALLMQRVTEE